MRKCISSGVIMGLILILVMGISLTVFAQKPVTIKIGHLYDPMGGPGVRLTYEWLGRVIKAFEAANPNIKVEQEIFQWDQIDVKAMADYRAGIKQHDVFFTSPQLMAQHNLVGDLLDLSPYIQSWPKKEIEDFSWSAAWASGIFGKAQFSLPTGAHTRALVYRRDMFKQVGLDPNNPPRNLEELIACAKRLTRDTDGDKKTDVWGLGMYYGPSRATIELYFAPFVWHYGGELWDPKTKKATFASDAGAKAAQFAYDVIYTHKITPEWAVSGTYDDDILRPFLDGKLGMAWGWGSYWISVLEDKGWLKGVFPPTPQGKPVIADVAITPTAPQAQFTNTWSLSIYKLSQHPKEAFKLIEFILKPENIIAYPDAGLPPRASLWQKPELQTPFYQTWRLAVAKGKGMPPTAHYGELADTVAAALQEILVNKAPIPKTLKKFEEEYNAQYAGE
ncbi:MAG: extracellular solute-binding protein [Firmicutes bacterium]|nr:extracellular solute-binding protein [Bacillota bacterium]